MDHEVIGCIPGVETSIWRNDPVFWYVFPVCSLLSGEWGSVRPWESSSPASADGASSWFLCSSRTHLGPLSDCCSDGGTPGPLHLSKNWEASHQLHLHIFVHEWFCTMFFDCSLFFCGSWWTTWTFWWTRTSQFVQLTDWRITLYPDRSHTLQPSRGVLFWCVAAVAVWGLTSCKD